MNLRVLLSTILIFFLNSCAHEMNSPLGVIEYHSINENGYTIKTLSENLKSEYFDLLKDLKINEKKGWVTSVNTYAPKIFLRANNNSWTLNITNDALILNQKSKNRKNYTQLAKKVDNLYFHSFKKLLDSQQDKDFESIKSY